MPFDLCETHTNLYKPEINLSAKFKTNFAKYQIQLHFLNTFRDEHSEEWTGVIFSLCIDLIYFVKRINSILHSISWEVDSYSAAQEFPVFQLEAHHSAHNSLPVDHILRQMNLVHTSITSFLKIHFKAIFRSAPVSQSGLFFWRFPAKTGWEFVTFPVHATCPMPMRYPCCDTLILICKQQNCGDQVYKNFPPFC